MCPSEYWHCCSSGPTGISTNKARNWTRRPKLSLSPSFVLGERIHLARNDKGDLVVHAMYQMRFVFSWRWSQGGLRSDRRLRLFLSGRTQYLDPQVQGEQERLSIQHYQKLWIWGSSPRRWHQFVSLHSQQPLSRITQLRQEQPTAAVETNQQHQQI